MRLNKIIILKVLLIFNLFSCQSVISENKEGGIVEVHLPDSIKGCIKVWELDSTWSMIDSAQIVNNKYILKYPHREMPTIIQLIVFPNIQKEKTETIWINNPYEPNVPYGNIVLDNSHTIIHAVPRMTNYFSCTHEDVKGSGNGRLEIIFPDSIKGLVYLKKSQNMQFLKIDSANVLNGKCVFHYNTSNITNERVSFSIKQTNSVILMENEKAGFTWNFLLKNHTYIKAEASPRRVCTGIIASLSGSPETDIQLQLMSNSSKCKDQQGHVLKSYIHKYSNSKLLLREVFYGKSSYSSTEELKQAFSLFSKENRESSKGKELANYIKGREEYDKNGITHAFSYFSADGKKHNLSDCIKDKKLCVIVFWASWCGPCLKEIPHLKDFYKEYKERVALVSLSIDDDYTKWTSRMKEYPVEWPNLSGLPHFKKKVLNNFGISTIPCFMIVDSKGKVICSQYIQQGNEIKLIELEDVKRKLNEILSSQVTR